VSTEAVRAGTSALREFRTGLEMTKVAACGLFPNAAPEVIPESANAPASAHASTLALPE